MDITDTQWLILSATAFTIIETTLITILVTVRRTRERNT